MFVCHMLKHMVSSCLPLIFCTCPVQSLDICFLHHTIAATLAQKGHSVQLLFAFEYIILASAAAATFLKYILSMLDAAMEGRWDGKGTYVFYLELLTDMLHLFVYCIFFVIVFTNYGLPLHLVSGWQPGWQAVVAAPGQ